MVTIGDPVMFTDEYGQDHAAVVTTLFKRDDGEPGVNLLFVSSDESQIDQYGRQIVRKTSVVHKSHQAAHGYYWDYL